MIDTMLNCQTHKNNPLVKSSSNNSVSIMSLYKIPLGRFSKKDRERIMKSWLPDPENEKSSDLTFESTALDPGVLSLKIKIMKLPTFYEVCNSNLYLFMC
jgi:nucleolar pre-ribosomal-associated protein 2